jgi:dTDP-4-amino-4,6-dideoxygalactose transaminase
VKEVSFFSFKDAPAQLKVEWLDAIEQVIATNQFVGGDYVREFEDLWAREIEVNFAIGVGNGLDGLVVALTALGISKGSFVAVPAHTFIATWNAVKLVGAIPVGIDVDQYGLMDLNILENLDLEFSCVIPVHMHGAMVDMPRLCNWAKRQKVSIIEDASQAHLAKVGDTFAGKFSDVGVFSLYPTKNLGALGDAGIVVTDSKDLADKMRSFTNYGASIKNKYHHLSFGVNSRLDPIQAAVLSVNLKYLNSWNDRRKYLANLYISNIQERSGLKLLHGVIDNSVWHHFPVLSNSRDNLVAYLKTVGVATEIHYPLTAASEYFRISDLKEKDFPIARDLSEKILSLPMSPWHTDEDILYVCKVLNDYTFSGN